MVNVIDGSEFKKDVLDQSGVALVDFFATWCGPCKQLAPILDKISDDYSGKIKFYKLDIDQNQDLAREYRIMSVPTLKVFKDGEVEDTLVGLLPEDALKQKLDKYL